MIGVRKVGIQLIPRGIPPFLACQAVPNTRNEVHGMMYSSCRGLLLLETFRFEEENDYECEI